MPGAPSHIQYFATSYWESHDQTGRAAIRLDGVEVLRSNYYAYEQNYWNRYQALRREASARTIQRPLSGWPMKGH